VTYKNQRLPPASRGGQAGGVGHDECDLPINDKSILCQPGSLAELLQSLIDGPLILGRMMDAFIAEEAARRCVYSAHGSEHGDALRQVGGGAP
jgi:hypothetical protein